MKTHLIRLAASASIFVALAAPISAQEIGGVRLTGGVWADGARKSIQGRAMVCAMKSADSFLSLRTGPMSSAVEIVKLNPLTIVELTGNVTADKKWAEVESVVFEIDAKGHELPEKSQAVAPLSGWLHTGYLCNYFY